MKTFHDNVASFFFGLTHCGVYNLNCPSNEVECIRTLTTAVAKAHMFFLLGRIHEMYQEPMTEKSVEL